MKVEIFTHGISNLFSESTTKEALILSRTFSKKKNSLEYITI